MSWLARLEIDAETINKAGISGDIYAWHKRLWECYPGVSDKTRKEIGFLTRIDQLDGAFRLWVLAKQLEPKRPEWCPQDGFKVNKIAASFLTHRAYAFDLRANPTKGAVHRDVNNEPIFRVDGKMKRGKRIPIVKQDELRAWLVQKSKVRSVIRHKGAEPIEVPGGFQIREDKPLEISRMMLNHFRKNGQSGYHGGVQFRGVLEVTDTAQFIDTYYAGVGSAKGFGFGLLLLSPVNV
jgi:CRISPR system Cascade subunit CasE